MNELISRFEVLVIENAILRQRLAEAEKREEQGKALKGESDVTDEGE